MLEDGVEGITGTFMSICCICCCLTCSNNIMYASSLSSYANVSHSWSLSEIKLSYGGLQIFSDYSEASTILYSEGNGAYPPFGFGFFTNQTLSHSYILAIYIGSLSDENSSPVVVWCANRDHPVGDEATLELTSEGELILSESGRLVWSTNTSGRSVSSLHLKHDGNLVLLNGKGDSIWESYGLPTDTLLHGQRLSIRQRLTSSYTNFSTGNYYVFWDDDGLHAFVDLDLPQEYHSANSNLDHIFEEPRYVHNYMRLDQNGRLSLYNWNQSESKIAEVFGDDDCIYPMTCGKYGVCTNGGHCGCPIGNDGSLDYFKPLIPFDANSGCTLVTPLSCSDTHKLNTFLEIEHITYLSSTPSLQTENVEICKSACLANCSCKAAFFDILSGSCTLSSELLTMIDVSNRILNYDPVAFIKVQKNSSKVSSKRKLILSISACLILVLIIAAGVGLYILMRRRITAKNISYSIDVTVDTVCQLSFESLRLATQDFQNRLGRGGFGTVFEGTLGDGTKVAVKRLDSMGQGRKEFLAEVNTIGSLRHFNLVRLIGFCDDGLNRLLVYEYMCNGSLEKWIFKQDIAHLSWHIQQRIINGVAAGLEYLHVHCKQSVIHFDIKPQNILLDNDFNVKIADFGLAKMVDRDQSQVLTIVRGTLGYMAPELISGDRVISVKVDVYSFGVLVLEILCGRRNFGSTEDDCLTNLVKLKANENQLYDLIDERAEAMQQHKEEVVNMMKIALWCLQPHVIRPTISMVVKVLQDLRSMESISDLSHYEAAPPVEANYEFSVRPTESLLSGPR